MTPPTRDQVLDALRAARYAEGPVSKDALLSVGCALDLAIMHIKDEPDPVGFRHSALKGVHHFLKRAANGSLDAS